MRYQQFNQAGQYPYPNHDIDPKEKGAEWCMQYAKAAYYDWSFVYPKGVLAGNGGDYTKYRMYALGKQPIDQYKNVDPISKDARHTWLAVDYTVRPIISVYRDKVISRLMEQDYNVIATPIDMLAKSEMEDYYASLKAKLAVRQLMMQQNPELASHPLIANLSGEPMDIEELEMRMELGEQFNRSKDAEIAIQYTFYQNDYKTKRRKIYEDLFDLGIAGVKDGLDDNGKPYFRVCDPDRCISSFSQDNTFDSIVHAGEIIDVPLVDLAVLKDEEGNSLFTEKELTEFAQSIAGNYGNPRMLGINAGFLNKFDKFKCQVLDIEFYTYNDRVYRVTNDEAGNVDFRKADYSRGKKSDKYTRKRIQYVYKCKWIIGTDKRYDWGMCYDQKRKNDPKEKAKTKLSYHFYAYNFYGMKAQGFMERLIPYIDDYQKTILKIENFKNRAVPSGWWIDLSSLEKVALTKGGSDMEPKELLQMFFETGVLIGRSEDEDMASRGANWRPVIPIENTAASELAMFYQDLVNTISAIEKITGYNDVTMGQASSKTLVPGYEMGQMSTTHALYPLAFSEENLTVRLAEAMICRMQQALKKNPKLIDEMPGINKNTLEFIKFDDNFPWRDYAIELDKMPTQDQRNVLLQMMMGDIQNGFLSTSDAVTLLNTKNIKQAQMIWAFRVKREKERQQQQRMAEIQAQAEGNKQAAEVAQQTELAKQQMAMQFELQKEQLRIQGELEKERMRIESAERIAMGKHYTTIESSRVQADGKNSAALITANSQLEKEYIKGQNQKPEKK